MNELFLVVPSLEWTLTEKNSNCHEEIGNFERKQKLGVICWRAPQEFKFRRFTSSAMVTPENSDMIGWMEKNNRAALAARA